MKLIGLNGRKLSGKDEAFKILRDNNPQLRFVRTSFADKMKLSGMRSLGYDFGVDGDMGACVAAADYIKDHASVTVEYDSGTEHKISGREFWQFYGTEGHRDVLGYDIWLDQVLPLPEGNRWADTMDEWLPHLFPDTDVVVETSARFENEARRVLDLGGEVWHIDADKRLGELDEHVSDARLPPEYITLTIPNNGTLEQFQHGVKAAWALSTGGVVR